MKLFGWKPGRVEARPALARAGVIGAAQGSWPQGYEAQVRAGYLSNPVAQRAVKLVAESVRATPFDAADEVRALVAAPLLGTVATQLLLHGDAFVQVLRGAESEAVELFALRPERVSVEADAFGCRLSFRWRSGGVRALDGVNGPVLTIEGRDAGGVARSWYVRLWNYAVGAPEDAAVSIDFAAVAGGFLLPGEADPVWAGDVDRMGVLSDTGVIHADAMARRVVERAGPPPWPVLATWRKEG